MLYLIVFFSIAFLWRPTDHNRRLAMSDELATDEMDAEDYEIGTLSRSRLRAEEGRDGHKSDDEDDEEEQDGHVRDDAVVFDIGDAEDEDESKRPLRGSSPPPSYAS